MTPRRFAAAYIVDWFAGDPRSFPHPVRLIGKAVSLGERLLRPGRNPNADFLSGSLLTAAIVAGSWQVTRIAVRKGSPAIEVLLAWTTLATRSLLDETAAVLDALDSEDFALALRRLGRIVGRDTASLAFRGLEGQNYLRVAVRLETENARLLEALTAIFGDS